MVQALIQAWSHGLAFVRRRRVVAEREILFRRIEQCLYATPDPASVKFGQAALLKQSRIVECLSDAPSGTLYITIESTFEGITGHHSYSLYVTGDLFRIGLLLYGGLESAPSLDVHNETEKLWPGIAPEHHDRRELSLYEWTSLVPDLYDSYVTQERYILGMRHMHCRVLRIIHDFRKEQAHDPLPEVDLA